ncbi:MAG: hypothetical protein DRH30_10080 [Deltaproteobacteria bacterium]|nr:MAG: hypothetical protein DRH30_10080 [Deltaproteobacteria bacterium]
MAVVPFQFYTSTASVREDLIPEITNISPTDTPFTSRIGKTTAKQRTHEWLNDALEARTAQTPQVEGAAFASTTRAARTRLLNYVEILDKPWTVSGSIEAMDTVSNGKTEFRYQRDLRRQELANGQEYRCVVGHSAGVSGDSATASQLKGLLFWITGNADTATADRTLTLAMLNNAAQSCWTDGGKPNILFTATARKANLVNVISTSYGSRELPGGSGTVDQRVETFYGEYGGPLEVVLSRDLDSGSLALLETMRWKLAYLRRPNIQVMGKEGDRRSAQWVSEFTLESRAESANAKIQDISG